MSKQFFQFIIFKIPFPFLIITWDHGVLMGVDVFVYDVLLFDKVLSLVNPVFIIGMLDNGILQINISELDTAACGIEVIIVTLMSKRIVVILGKFILHI